MFLEHCGLKVEIFNQSKSILLPVIFKNKKQKNFHQNFKNLFKFSENLQVKHTPLYNIVSLFSSYFGLYSALPVYQYVFITSFQKKN